MLNETVCVECGPKTDMLTWRIFVYALYKVPLVQAPPNHSTCKMVWCLLAVG